MNKQEELKFILENRELAIHKKKSELQKSDYANVLFEETNKAFDNDIKALEVLVYEAEISKSRNEYMFNQYKSGYVLNHSVGMRYIKLFFCYNSEDPAYSQDKENWDKYYPMVLNKGEADKWGYFWAIVEAKNIEGSAVVKGSNFLTPVLSMTVIDENTIKVKLAISPSNVMDSHSDVHIPGIWKKTLNENQYDLLLQVHNMKDFEYVITDSVSGKLDVYTEIIPVKELLSKFVKADKSEPSDDTQKNHNTEPPVGTQQPKKNNNLLMLS